MNKAEALLFVPGYYVLGRSYLDTNPVRLDQVKSNQWDAKKGFSPIHGHTADIVEDVVYGKIKHRSVVLWKRNGVQIKLLEYHGIRDSRTKVSARQLRISSSIWRRTNIAATQSSALSRRPSVKSLSGASYPKCIALLWRTSVGIMPATVTTTPTTTRRWSTRASRRRLRSRIPCSGCQSGPSLLCIERNLTLTLGGPIRSDLGGLCRPVSVERDQRHCGDRQPHPPRPLTRRGIRLTWQECSPAGHSNA